MDELVEQTQTSDQHVLESGMTVGNTLYSKPTEETDDKATSIVLLTMIGPQGASLVSYRWQSFPLWALVHSGIVLKGHLETFPVQIPLK